MLATDSSAIVFSTACQLVWENNSTPLSKAAKERRKSSNPLQLQQT